MSDMWHQFRRLLLGTVIEAMLEHDVAVDFASIRIEFDDDSAFRVPRLNNYMRFSGSLRARLTTPLPDPGRRAIERSLRQAWPSLLRVVDIPIGDRLTSDRNEIRVRTEGDDLNVGFDLIAD